MQTTKVNGTLCPNSDIWAELAAGDLDRKTAAALREHAGRCVSCRAELDAVAALFARARSVPIETPSPELAARTWSALPSAPVRHRPRLRPIAWGAALTAAAGLTAFALLPGAPLRPSPSFAHVEQAMSAVRTVTFQTRAYSLRIAGDGKVREEAADRSTMYADLERVWQASRSTEGDVLVVRGDTLMFRSANRQFYILNDPWRFQRLLRPDGEPRVWIRDAVLFAQTPAERGAREGHVDGSQGFVYTIRRSAWSSSSATLDGHKVDRFDCDLVSTRQRGPNSKGHCTVWTNPANGRVIRREDRYEPYEAIVNGRRSGARGTRLICENYRYNERLPAALFARPEPEIGQLYMFQDYRTQPNTTYPLPIPPETLLKIRPVVREAVAAWNRRDSHAFGALWNVEACAWDAQFNQKLSASAAGTQASELRRLWMTKVSTQQPYRNWRVREIIAVAATDGVRLRRPGDIFPPTTGPNRFKVIAKGVATSATGGSDVAMDAAMMIVRDQGQYRILWIEMNRAAPPVTPAVPDAAVGR